MMSDIGPGDVVVCVDAAPEWPGQRVSLIMGKAYRVRAVGVTPQRRRPALHVGEITRSGGPVWRATTRFRKIDKADDSFIEQITAARPREVEPA